MDSIPPARAEPERLLLALVRCRVCNQLEGDVHTLEWVPHVPPAADGYQRGVHGSCFRAAVGVRQQVPKELEREVEAAIPA